MIGVIVDSDLGNLPAYNRREKPLSGDFLLPPGFELVYATTDAARDNIASAVLSRCDQYADLVFDESRGAGTPGG
jgi:hypothetical protein